MNCTPGDHLITSRTGYTHHGIYVGNGQVIHYAGLANGLEAGPVELVEMDSFTSGERYWVRAYNNGLNRHEIVRRARSRLGERKYNVLNNNCEHFCHWCCVGDHVSPQVQKAGKTLLATAAPLVMTAAAFLLAGRARRATGNAGLSAVA